MPRGGGHRTTMGAGFGMAAMVGAGGLVPGCPPICGVRLWWVFLVGVMAVWAGPRWRPMRGFSLGGGAERGAAVLALTDRMGFTVCGMRGYGAFTAMSASAAVLSSPVITGSAVRINSLVLRRANSLEARALFMGKCRLGRIGRVICSRIGKLLLTPGSPRFPTSSFFNIDNR